MYRHTTMTRRLVFWFLLIAIAPVLFAVVVIYFQRAESIKNEAYSKLTAIRDLKVRKIEWWLDHRIGDLETLAQHLRGQGLERLLTSEEPVATERIRRIRSLLAPYTENFEDYRELSIIDARTAHAWISTKPDREGLDRSSQAYFTQPLASKQLYISRIYMSPTENIPVMEFSVPVFCEQHDGAHVAAVLAARIDLKTSLYRLLGERVGLGKTGETVLVDRSRLVLNDLRWHEDAPLRLTLQGQAGRRAARGETGVIETADYRNVEVFAAYAHLPKTGWGMVVKQDLAELHQPIERMLWQLAVAVILLAVVVSIAAVLLARSTTRPVLAIAEVAQRIRRGDVAARCNTSRHDELAAMGQSINEMADSLVAQTEVQRGIAEVSEAMVVSSAIPDFAKRLIGSLMRVTNSHLAGFFRHDRDSDGFQHVASVGLHADLLRPFHADVLEGQLGPVLESRQITFLDGLGADTQLTFKTVVGDVVPGELATIPLISRDQVVAVIALGTLKRYSAEQREILRLTWAGANAAFANLLASEKSDRMAEELRIRNEELAETNRALELQSERLQRQADELTKLAAELDVRRAQVEEAGRLKSEFLSNMSHELRTPLSSIIALSQLILSRGPSPGREKEAEFVHIIERNGRELLTLINDILDLSKIEAGRLDVQPGPVSPQRVLDAAIETITPSAREKDLDLRVDVLDAPEIESDEGRIRQILLNLLSNAVKFTDSGRIEVSVDSDEESVFFSVTDTGIGIAQSDLEIIFDEFRQIDGTTTRSHGGSGLGLAICAKLAGLLGGSISVVSEHGQGSTFTLTLPRRFYPAEPDRDSSAQAAAPAARSAAPRTAEPRSAPIDGSGVVLVVEDNPDNMVTITAILDDIGVAHAGAGDGVEAVEMAVRLRPRVILMDIQLPVMNGLEAAQAIRKNPALRHIPIVAVTARAMKGDRERMLDAGCDDYLAKPIDPEALQAMVFRWLGERSTAESA